MIVDYHIHTPFCGHAQGKIIEYVESAINAGIPEIGFSDHLGRYYLSAVQRRRYWDWGMSIRNLDRYLNEIKVVQKVYADRIIIRIGLEVDYIEGAEHLIEKIIGNFPFDYILGSIHCIPALGWHHLSQYSKSDSEKIYKWYFNAAHAALVSGLFQSLAHIDFIWRYIPWPESRNNELSDYIADIVSISNIKKTALEINANGFIWSQINKAIVFNPFLFLLEKISEQKAAITLGSDAHAPQLVAKCFPEIVNLLKNKGIHHISLCEQKKRISVALG